MANHLVGPADITPDYNAELRLDGLQAYVAYYPNVIPLFQSPGYARACLGRAAVENNWSESQLDEAVAQRMDRSEWILGNTAVRKTLIIAEPALLDQRGSAADMAETIGRVKRAFIQPPENTTLRLLPLRAIPGTEHLRGNYGSYTITSSQENGIHVWTADALHADPEDSLVYQETVSILGLQVDRLSVPNDQAIAIISRAKEQWDRKL